MNVKQTKYNTTQLHIDKAEDRGIVHRDYLAHCLRWTHIVKYTKVGQRVLDAGCGLNTPLAWTMYTNKFRPGLYVGLDFRSDFDSKPGTFPFPVELIGGFDVTSNEDWDKFALKHLKSFDIISCLEVLEHMPKEAGIKLLQNLAIQPGRPTIFLSTPCFNGGAAANHIYEWRYLELYEELQKYFQVEAHYGTFGSQADYVPLMTPEEARVFIRLKDYYDSNVLAVIFAPLYPAGSRNCIWRLRTQS